MRSGRRAIAGILAIGLLTWLVSCGGGASVQGGGITGTGIAARGVITGFGSIFVNATEFDVDAATVTINGNTGSEADLRLGMVATVLARGEAGTSLPVASSVTVDDVVEGPVETVDAAGGMIVVLGQLVLVDASTVYDGVTLATLQQGDRVEINGFLDADGNVHATRIELDGGAGGAVELEGIIANLNASQQTFMLGVLVVDYASAQIENAPSGGLVDGLLVEVDAPQPAVAGVLTADHVRVRSNEFEGREGEDVEVEGFITQVVAADEFVVDSVQPVRIDSSTSFENGSAADIVVNVRVHAKGTLDASDVLVASQLEFDD